MNLYYPPWFQVGLSLMMIWQTLNNYPLHLGVQDHSIAMHGLLIWQHWVVEDDIHAADMIVAIEYIINQ